MGQLNFFEGDEGDENPEEVRRLWDEQSNPSPTPTPRRTPEEHRLDEEPARYKEQPDYELLAAINRGLRQPKNIPTNEDMLPDLPEKPDVKYQPLRKTAQEWDDELIRRMRRRALEEGWPGEPEPSF
jgi:hypothetical protein